MPKLIKNFTLGGCGANNALDLLIARDFFPGVFRSLGFLYTPYALSSGAAIQLHRVCVAEQSLPEAARMLAYAETNQPSASTRHLVDASEIALIELSTPIEPLIGDAIVNFNRIADSIITPLRASSADKRMVSDWTNALVNARDDLRERGGILLDNWPSDLIDDGMARFGVEQLWSRRLTTEDMVRDLQALQERLDTPMVLKLFNFRYMPDGRAIDWPAGFKSQQIDVAKRLGMPTLDFAPIVERLGPKRLIVDESAYNHLRPESHALQAELIYDVMADVLGRPYLDSYAEWLDDKRGLNAAFPEFPDGPARMWFPEVARILPTVRGSSHSTHGWTARGGDTAGRTTIVSPRPGLASRVNAELLSLHRERLIALGPQTSGLYDHYRRLVERETLLGPREIRTFSLIESYLPDYEAYAVMRAGLGELAFLLAASGRRTLAYEPDRYRGPAIEAGRARLEAMGLLAPGMLTVIPALTPQTPLDARVLGLGLDVAHVRTEAAAAPLLEGVREFEALLIDLRLFLRRREDPSEQMLVAEEIQNLGFDERRDYPRESVSWFGRARARDAKSNCSRDAVRP